MPKIKPVAGRKIEFYCPGCMRNHVLPLGQDAKKSDGGAGAPGNKNFISYDDDEPSYDYACVLYFTNDWLPSDLPVNGGNTCEFRIKKGKIDYGNSCTHALKKHKNVPIVNIP